MSYFFPNREGLNVSALYVHTNPEALRDGLRPTKGCAARFIWFRDDAVKELAAFVRSAKKDQLSRPDQDSFYCGLFAAAKRGNPARVLDMLTDWETAAYWELKRYGNVAVELRQHITAPEQEELFQ